MKRHLLFGVLFFAIIACPALAQTDIELSTDTLYFPDYYFGGGWCYPLGFSETLFVKNIGTTSVELGFSVSCDYWHIDTIGAYGDTIRFWGRFDHSHPPSFFSIDASPEYSIWTSPRFCGEGYYDPCGISLAPGDSLFFYLLFQPPFCPTEFCDTIRVSVHGRSGLTTDTEQLIWECCSWGCYFGDPPDTLTIDSVDATAGSERVFLRADRAAWMDCGDYHNVYRDTLPLFFMFHLDTTHDNHNKIGITDTRYFNDDFSDTLWPHYWESSKGVEDTLVNLFYVFTSVDTGSSASDGFTETCFPSQCVCEFDQPLYTHSVYGSRNWISIPNVDSRYRYASDLDSLGITQVKEWNVQYQVPVLVGASLPGFGWVLDGPLKIGHVYSVFGTHGVTPPIFSTNTPGWIPQCDSVFSLCYNPILGGRNIIMLPFRASIIENIHDRAMLETSIEDVGAVFAARLLRIDRWNGSAFIWEPIAEYIPFLDLWTANPHLRAGMPYRIWIDGTSGGFCFTWPIT